MKTEFKTKFLQHLQQKREDKGFTLIELLVVIIIIGILSAIALPAFLNQANKAKQSEAKQTASAVNKAQQAKYTEFGKFGTSCDDIGVAVKTTTSNYNYTCSSGAGGVANAFVNSASIAPAAPYKAYSGLVVLTTTGGETSTVAKLCEANQTGGGSLGAGAGTSQCNTIAATEL